MWPRYSVLLQLKEDPQRYVKPFFTIAAYKKIYEQPLIPLDLSNVNGDAIHSPPGTVVSDQEESESEEDDPDVLPPSTRRPPGRPRKRRIRGKHDEVIVQNACSNVLGVRELDIRKGLVVQDSTHQHNCLQLHL